MNLFLYLFGLSLFSLSISASFDHHINSTSDSLNHPIKSRTTCPPLDLDGLGFTDELRFPQEEFPDYILSQNPNFVDLTPTENTGDHPLSLGPISPEPSSSFDDDLLKFLGMLEQSTDQSNENINNDNDIGDGNNVGGTATLEISNPVWGGVNGANSHVCDQSKTTTHEVIYRSWNGVNGDCYESGGPSSETAPLEDSNRVCGEVNGANFNSGGPSETAPLEDSNRICGEVNGANFDSGGPSETAPLTQTALCRCNNMLREIVYTKDGKESSLRIFGEIGFVCHIFLLIHLLSSDKNERREKVVDMRGYTWKGVHKYIEDYCNEQITNGFTLVEDPNSDFYQAMSATSIFNPPAPLMLTLPSLTQAPMSVDEAIDAPPVLSHAELSEESVDAPHVLSHSELREPTLAEQDQIEKTAELSRDDLISLFHLPIKKAGEKKNMCETTLRNICRKHRVQRWPYRQLKANNVEIARCEKVLQRSQDSEVKALAEAKIQHLQKQHKKIASDAFKKKDSKFL